jgi:hypothetical protein
MRAKSRYSGGREWKEATENRLKLRETVGILGVSNFLCGFGSDHRLKQALIASTEEVVRGRRVATSQLTTEVSSNTFSTALSAPT